MPVTLFRTLASATTLVGVVLLVLTFSNWHQGELAARYYPGLEHAVGHHFKGLLLALPAPLHVVFIGLILQKRHLTAPWRRFAWVGITASGIWLGISLAVRNFWL